MATRNTTRWLGIAAAIFLAFLLWGVLSTETVDAQGYRYGMHGMMGYPMMMDHHMGYPMGMTTTTTNTVPYGYPHGGWGMHGMMGHHWGTMPCESAGE